MWKQASTTPYDCSTQYSRVSLPTFFVEAFWRKQASTTPLGLDWILENCRRRFENPCVAVEICGIGRIQGRGDFLRNPLLSFCACVYLYMFDVLIHVCISAAVSLKARRGFLCSRSLRGRAVLWLVQVAPTLWVTDS